MSEATRYTPHYSIEDYRRWEGDWELWHGVPVSMSPSPTPRHQLVGTNILRMLTSAMESDQTCDCIAIYETDWHIGNSTVVRPDISVLCSGLPNQFINYAPSLIVEILSPSTAEKDRTAKRRLYESERVNTYVMVDPDREAVEALQLSGDAYVQVATDAGVLDLSWEEGCHALLSADDIFAMP